VWIVLDWKGLRCIRDGMQEESLLEFRPTQIRFQLKDNEAGAWTVALRDIERE